MTRQRIAGPAARVYSARMLDPGQVIAPYDCTLLDQGRHARAKWGQIVVSQLARLGLAGETFAARGPDHLQWSAVLPPSAFRTGRNQVQLYQVIGPGRLRLLGAA